jgi:hypothetical protein
MMILVSNFAFNFNLRHYTLACRHGQVQVVQARAYTRPLLSAT